MQKHYWHDGIQEYFSQMLNIILVRYKSESILFKESVLEDLEEAKIKNYMIFELFSEWDILIRFWSTERSANMFVSRLDRNMDIEKVHPLTIKTMEHSHDDPDTYPTPTTQEIRNLIDTIGITPLIDIQQNREKSDYYEMALKEGLLLRDNLSFDPKRIQFYIIIRSLRRLPDVAKRIIISKTASYGQIKAKTIYFPVEDSIRTIIKGQADEFYEISNFLIDITSTLRDDNISVSTETALVANQNIRTNNVFDFTQAEEDIVEKRFQELEKQLDEPMAIDLAEKYELKALLHKVINIMHLDDQRILENILKAQMSKNSKYVKNVKEFFPHFEQEMKDNLPKVIRREYGNNWKEILDILKESEGINKSIKADKLTIGDLSKIYKHIVLEKRIVSYIPLKEADFSSIMDEMPTFRNTLAHTKASLEGLRELFDFSYRFLPIRSEFLRYFKSL